MPPERGRHPSPPFDGHLDFVQEGWAVGWAWRSDAPATPIAVTLLADGAAVLTAKAEGHRPDLEQAGKGDGRHAFAVALPAALFDGREHEIRVVFDSTGTDLWGSPHTLPADTEASTQPRPDATGFRSPFGGLWTDRDSAREEIGLRERQGRITPAEATLLRDWMDDGFVILPQAVPLAAVEELEALVEQVWSGTAADRYFVEYWEHERHLIEPAGPQFRDRPVKLLNVHMQSEAARRVVFADPIQRFLSLIFDGPVLAFQSLYFRWGSRQEPHQDSAFVRVSSPLELAASWVALEDVTEGSGELEYFVGSHRLEDYLFDGRFKWMPFRSGEYGAFIQSLRDRSDARGLERRRFLPRRGDALIWSADLVHGGSRDARAGITRKSLVSHYCPAACSPVSHALHPMGPRQQHADDAFFTGPTHDPQPR